MTTLMVVLGSVRETRMGKPIADWVCKAAQEDGRFHVDFADLKEVALPLMDEPNHPRLRQYTKEHTIAWSERVSAADGFIFLFPEYNHSYSAPIKNALDYLNSEWYRKPVGFVNWGGNSGGTRAQAALRPVVTLLGMIMTAGNIEINFPGTQITDGVFEPTDQQREVLAAQLDEIAQLSSALAPLQN